ARMPQSFSRRLVSDLITSGIGARDAWAAVNALTAYLDQKGLQPKELLVAELGKIHPQLLPKTLETLVGLTADGNLVARMGEQKAENLRRSNALRNSFQSTLSALTPVLIAV